MCCRVEDAYVLCCVSALELFSGAIDAIKLLDEEIKNAGRLENEPKRSTQNQAHHKNGIQ